MNVKKNKNIIVLSCSRKILKNDANFMKKIL